MSDSKFAATFPQLPATAQGHFSSFMPLSSFSIVIRRYFVFLPVVRIGCWHIPLKKLLIICNTLTEAFVISNPVLNVIIKADSQIVIEK